MGGPTSFNFYAIVVVSFNKIFQFNSIQYIFQLPYMDYHRLLIMQ